jgi:hypothetical protein
MAGSSLDVTLLLMHPNGAFKPWILASLSILIGIQLIDVGLLVVPVMTISMRLDSSFTTNFTCLRKMGIPLGMVSTHGRLLLFTTNIACFLSRA